MAILAENSIISSIFALLSAVRHTLVFKADAAVNGVNQLIVKCLIGRAFRVAGSAML